MIKLTIVIPCFNEKDVLPAFYERLCSVTNKLVRQYEIAIELLFVDDGSSDGTVDIIEQYSKKASDISYLSFSRNFGKEAAIYAGLEHAQGEYVALLDADLQDPPELLEQMYKEVESGMFDCAAARRTDREGEPLVRSFFARCFYKIIRKMSGLEIVDGARDFRLMNKKMHRAILLLDEKNRFSKGLFPWVGFTTKWIEYENTERAGGQTKWSFIKLLFYAFDGIVAFSSAPLTIVSLAGILFMILSAILVLFIIAKKLIWGDPVAGWPSLACIIFFTSGAQCFFTGILGYYISKIYAEIKRRPHYILKDKKHLKHDSST